MKLFGRFVIKLALLGTVCLVSSPPLMAGFPQKSGIYFNHGDSALTDLQVKELIQNLRCITGLNDLYLTSDGALSVDRTNPSKTGSLTARNILLQAIDSGIVFIIEDYSGSHTIHFGQLDQGTNYEDFGKTQRLLIFSVRLDFKDFKEMEAPQEVRKSFDIGFVLLHELLHGLGYEDTKERGEIGNCERLINQARTEIGLPIREHYIGERVFMRSGFATIRLSFRSAPQSLHRTRSRRYYLYFLNRSYPGSETTARSNSKHSSRTFTKDINSSIQR